MEQNLLPVALASTFPPRTAHQRESEDFCLHTDSIFVAQAATELRVPLVFCLLVAAFVMPTNLWAELERF